MDRLVTVPLDSDGEAGAEEVSPPVAAQDVAAVEAARAGDRLAFAQLYRRFGPVVHGIVLARVPRTEVDDVVQEIFVQVLRALPTLRDATKFGGWIARLARNRALDHRRRVTAVSALPDDLLQSSPEQGRALFVLAKLRELPEAYRETLILRFVEGLTGPEIAERVGMTHGSVRVNLHRGMQMLRGKLEDGR